MDKVLHFFAWVVLSFLFFRAYAEASFLSCRNNLVTRKTIWTLRSTLIWISFLSATLYGVSDEVHQYFVPFRSADTMDAVADMVGSLCGALGGAWWYGFYCSPSTEFGPPSKRTSVDQVH